jgi:RimJ/RimL family protein N-acetyltransferase
LRDADKEVVESLIARGDAGDAVAAYYAWWHPEAWIHVHQGKDGVGLLLEGSGTLGPVSILRASSMAVVPVLIEAMSPGRRYLMAPWDLADAIRGCLRMENTEHNAVFWLEPSQSAPKAEGTAATRVGGSQAVTIKVEGNAVIAAVGEAAVSRCWYLWKSPEFAEIGVRTDPAYREQGLGQAVVSAMLANLSEKGLKPLFVTNIENVASLRLADALGFTRYPADEFACYVVRP